jgi:hypothetical protein
MYGADPFCSWVGLDSPLMYAAHKAAGGMTSVYRQRRSLFGVVRPGGSIHCIVGNSKSYDVLLPVEKLYAAMFKRVGFVSVHIDVSRKRTSKKELFEFVVSACKPTKK